MCPPLCYGMLRHMQQPKHQLVLQSKNVRSPIWNGYVPTGNLSKILKFDTASGKKGGIGNSTLIQEKKTVNLKLTLLGEKGGKFGKKAENCRKKTGRILVVAISLDRCHTL